MWVFAGDFGRHHVGRRLNDFPLGFALFHHFDAFVASFLRDRSPIPDHLRCTSEFAGKHNSQ